MMTKAAALVSLIALGYVLLSPGDFAAAARTRVADTLSSVAGFLNQGPVLIASPHASSKH